MQVPLLDLKAQYKTLKKELDSALINVAESQHFIMGPNVQKLEEELCEYLGCKYAIGVSSGTDALVLALMALDIQPGDEVIVPTYSFFATAGAVVRLNAIPVFVDCDPLTFNIDVKHAQSKITERTKAIIPVHLYGQSADMEEVMALAAQYSLYVIEDGAQAISARYKNGLCVGTIGDIGCYSFFPSKNLGCFGDGGLCVTNDDKLAEALRIKRVHGGKPKYYHKVIGGNFRLDAIQAAVLSVKLPHLDSWSEKRRQNAEIYTKLLIEAGVAEETGKTCIDHKNKVLLPKAVYKETGHKNYHIFNQYVIRVEDRDGLRKYLTDKGIGNEVYYPVPFHRQECFSNLSHFDSDFPNSNYAAEHSIALPIYPELAYDQIKYVTECIINYLK